MPITLRNTIQKGLIGNEWGVPTIYKDPETGKIVKSDKITVIGEIHMDKIYRDNETVNPTVLPPYVTVIQVGTAVKEVHYIQVQDSIIPNDIFKYAVNVTDFSNVLRSTRIKKIPDGLFDSCTKAADFSYAFTDCVFLKAIPTGLFDKNTLATDFSYTFFNCMRIEAIPEGLFDHCSSVVSFNATFNDCQRFTSIPEGLFNSCPMVTSFNSTFAGCESLKSIPEDLFQNNPKVTDFRNTFSYCLQLEGQMPMVTAPNGKKYKLWKLEGRPGYPTHIDGTSCFDSCKKLKGYRTIPNDWKSNDWK